MKIIGITDRKIHHDSSICLVENGKVAYASMEERFSRVKNDPRAPLGALSDVFDRFNLSLDEVDAVAIGMPPFNFLKNFIGLESFQLVRMVLPLFFKNPKSIIQYIRTRRFDGSGARIGFEWLNDIKYYYISHYTAHAASAYRTSGFDDALCIVLDAAGSDEEGTPLSGAVFTCHGGEMHRMETVSRFNSIGCFYNSVTQAAGFRTVGEDWKLMGLAAFGDPEKCLRQMQPLSPDFRNGHWVMNRYALESKLIDNPKLLKYTKLWSILSDLVDRYGDKDVAAAAQRIFEDVVLRFFEYLLEKYPNKNIALAGGVFHNIKFCMRLQQRFPDLVVYVHPAAGDSGVSVGAALELYHRLTGEPTNDALASMALGADYSESEILGELHRFIDQVTWTRPDNIAQSAAELLVSKHVIGLFNGRAEWGPRALGQRSVIADPRDPSMKNHINKSLKNREWFMPFAPSIIEEDGPVYLKEYFYSPFMTHAFPVTDRALKDIPSAIHLDGTARPQIVRQRVVPHYHAIISAFKELTGVGAVLNTSFNRHGLPMINSPKDALEHLLWGCIDALVMGPFVVKRKGDIVPYKRRYSLYTEQMIGKYDPFDDRLLAIRDRRDREGER